MLVLMTDDLLCPLFAHTPISGCRDTSFILFVPLFIFPPFYPLPVTKPLARNGAVCPPHNIKGPVITLFSRPLVKYLENLLRAIYMVFSLFYLIRSHYHIFYENICHSDDEHHAVEEGVTPELTAADGDTSE